MRPLLFLINTEELYTYNNAQMKYMIIQLFKIDERDSQNSCSEAICQEAQGADRQ